MIMLFALTLAATAQAVPMAAAAPAASADPSPHTQHQHHADHQKQMKQCQDMMATMHKGMDHHDHGKHDDASHKTGHKSH